MKIFYLSCLVLFANLLTYSQVYINEGFSAFQFPPPGWSATPIGPQWYLSSTNLAGGSFPEACFEGFTCTSTVRLASPVIDLTEEDTVILTFKNFADINNVTGLTMGVATRSQTFWHSVWEIDLTEDFGPIDVDILITNQDVGQNNFQLSFYLTGDLSSINNWYLDDIQLYYPTFQDCKMHRILTPELVLGPVPVIGMIKNLGNTIINEFSVSWISYNGVIHDSLFTGLNIGLFDDQVFGFERKWVSPPGSSDLKMWINSVNGEIDGNQNNDTLTKSIEFGFPVIPRRPCFEEFTANWCSACTRFHSFFVPWCDDHPDITLVKYHTNGDQYNNNDVDIRQYYYDVTGIPRTFCNGEWVQGNTSLVNFQNAYDSAITLISPFEIISQFSITDSIIDIATGILSHQVIHNTFIHTALVEKTTYENIGSNGETEHHHVMMKMFPDGNGDTVDFFNLIPYSQTFTYDLRQTNVEGLDDLLVAVLIQDFTTKEVLQSAYAWEDTNLSSNAHLSTITLDNIPIEGFDPYVYDYFIELPQGTMESPVVEGDPFNNGAMLRTVQAFFLPGQAAIGVYSEDRTSMQRYIVSFSFTTEIDEKNELAHLNYNLYPNPFFSGITLSYTLPKPVAVTIEIFNSRGQKVYEIIQEQTKGKQQVHWNAERLAPGIYYFRIQAGEMTSGGKMVKISN